MHKQSDGRSYEPICGCDIKGPKNVKELKNNRMSYVICIYIFCLGLSVIFQCALKNKKDATVRNIRHGPNVIIKN